MEGDTTRMRPEFEIELNKTKVQFLRIRDKNGNFVLSQFHGFMFYLREECFEFLF